MDGLLPEKFINTLLQQGGCPEKNPFYFFLLFFSFIFRPKIDTRKQLLGANS